MNTKTCKGCGWVYPITQPGRKCPICRTEFPFVICTSCRKVTPLERMEIGTCTCKACASKEDGKIVARRRKLLDSMFDDWIAKVKSVPRSYPALTETQWLEACRFFDGCARCGNKDIDTRGFFIGAKLGGRYCDWNVIPLCERCASYWDLEKSVFNYILMRDHVARSSKYRECLVKITNYLGGKLDAAAKAGELPTESTGDVKCDDNRKYES